ncbi:MAG: hypothetical protein IPK81_02440 [Rhodospirillales bacterium]|nr:MAG: hypothetical protein IPK81_02440 [Rhodospirillales bacterium]
MTVTFLRAAGATAAAVALLAACQPTTQAPAAPSTAYAKVAPPASGPVRGACLTPEEVQAVRIEIAWQQFYNAAIQCRSAIPAFQQDYGAFRSKFSADNNLNSAPLQRTVGKRGLNINTFKTDIANRDGGRAGGNPGYCANAMEGYRWALSQQVSNITQVPPMYDFSSDMGLRACAAAAAAPGAAQPKKN